VLVGGLSVVHDVNERLSLGGEIYGGIDDRDGLNRTQLQTLLGLQYGIGRNVTFSGGLIVGKYAASPRVGGQVGVAVDLR
jgi:hypothetical protein